MLELTLKEYLSHSTTAVHEKELFLGQRLVIHSQICPFDFLEKPLYV
jgi:hypothetical protein